VPYRIIGAISFYDRREVKDLLAYLRLITNPADDEAFLRAITVPKRGIGESSLAIVTEQGGRWQQSLLATARAADRVPELRPNVRDALRKFAALVDGLRERSASWPPAQVLEQLIQEIDYEAMLLAEGPEGADRWENVNDRGAAEWSEVACRTPMKGEPLGFLAEAALLSPMIRSPVEGGHHPMTLREGLEGRSSCSV
jgi:superfamily I DNA/RNA helicase